MKTDPDYRKNQQGSHQCWIEQNRDYYQRYRVKNPQYVTRNRLLQKLQDQKRRDRSLAKMDPISPQYLLIPHASPLLAKKDSMDSLSFPALECATKEAADHDGKSHPLSRPDPYLSLGPQGSHLFFQVISARHQTKSTLLATNLPFAEWGKVFDSTTVATAIADRLVHNSEVLILGGSSYRRKAK